MGSHWAHGGRRPLRCQETSRRRSGQQPRPPYRTRGKSCSLPLRVLSVFTPSRVSFPFASCRDKPSPVEMFQPICPFVYPSRPPSFGPFASLLFIVYVLAVSGNDLANTIAKVWSLSALNYPRAVQVRTCQR